MPSAPYTFGPLGGNIGNATWSQTYFARTFTTAITVTDNVGNTTARTVQVTPPLCPQPPTLPDEPEDSKTGWGWSTRPYKDICLDTNPNPDPWANQRGIDYSRSYYDRTCEEEVEPVVVEEIEDETQSDTPPTLQERTEKILQNTSFGEEMTFAYIFAYQQWITTMPSLEEANLLWPLYRRDMAKMISVFATVWLNLKADSWEECIFDDMQLETQESKYYATVSCQLGLMGLKTDGTPAQSFYSDQVVSRAMFGTILSRLLRWWEYNWWVVRYEKHLDALFSKNIMKFIDNPEQDELRWYVMIMMKRINDEEIVPERD